MSSNPNYKPSDGKREEFRKYLEKTGVMDALTKILVSLYEESDKPENAIEYICNKLATQICGESLDDLRARIEGMEAKLAEVEQVNAFKLGEAAVPGEGEEGLPQESEQERAPAAAEESEAPLPAE